MDSYGERTQIALASGFDEVDWGYTGRWHHNESELIIAPFRFCDPTLGRWISANPIEEAGGVTYLRMLEEIPPMELIS